MGDRSVGRWAVGSTRTLVQASDSGASSDEAFALMRQPSYDKVVGEVGDTAMLGVEIDVQVGQMTLRSKHLSALHSSIANHQDVIEIFGDQTIQASQLERADHRCRYKLVGMKHLYF